MVRDLQGSNPGNLAATLPVLQQNLAGCSHKVLGRACLELLQQEYGNSHFKSPPSLRPRWVSTFILTALGFGAPPVSGLCRADSHMVLG